MKLGRTMWLSASLLALSSQTALVTAQDMEAWQARTVDQVLSELEVDENQQVTYIVKEGDTLGVIAEAMKIELHYLANINGIDNVDLILPGTKLVAQFNQDQQATNLTVDTPQGQSYNIELPVNLTSDLAADDTAVPEFDALTEESVGDMTLIGGGEESENLAQTETVEASSVNQSYSPTMVEEWVKESPTTDVETISEASQDDSALLEVNSEDLVSTPVETNSDNTDASLADATQVDSSAVVDDSSLETVVTEEVTAPTETQLEPVVEDTTAVEVPAEVPAEEIPESVQEDVAAESEIQSEDIVVEDSTTVEETVDQTASSSIDPTANPENAGLQANVAAFKEEVASKFGVTSFSLYRAGDTGDHGTGKAVDFMVPVGSQLGDDIANYSIANMAANGISYVIWEQQIYGDWNNTWTPMEDRGSTTANHYDHVHVSFY